MARSRVLVLVVAAVVAAALLVAVATCAKDEPGAAPGRAGEVAALDVSAIAPEEAPSAARRPPRARAAAPIPADEETPQEEDAPAQEPEVHRFPELDIPGELPDSALGKGPCVLRLSLVDDATGAPFAARVRLWRLDVPEDADWKAGDHVQRKGDVPTAGLVWEELPAGRYLLQVDAQRRGAPPLPKIVLSASHEVTARLALPRPVAVRAYVFDASGRTMERCTMPGASRWARTHRAEPPDGVKPREPQRSRDELTLVHSGGGAMGATGGRWAQEVLFGSDGFELGSVAEATREATPRISFVLRFEGLCDVHIDATAEESAAGIWVGRVEPLAPLVARVRLADGRSAVEAGATISGACTALLRRPTDRTDLWRETVITVLVELDGWRDLSFSHPLGDPPPELTMERVEPK